MTVFIIIDDDKIYDLCIGKLEITMTDEVKFSAFLTILYCNNKLDGNCQRLGGTKYALIAQGSDMDAFLLHASR